MATVIKSKYIFYARKGQPFSVESELSYLFDVIYQDGSEFHQNPEDVSKKDSKKSAFYDVDVDQVKEFSLHGQMDDHPGIDLETGKFSFSGPETLNEFFIGEPGPKPYKLIFYRQHKHDFTMGFEEIDHTIKYCLGYTDAAGVEHKVYLE